MTTLLQVQYKLMTILQKINFTYGFLMVCLGILQKKPFYHIIYKLGNLHLSYIIYYIF